MDRRSLLKKGVLGTLAGGLLGVPAVSSATKGDKRKRLLRFAHLTDVHIYAVLYTYGRLSSAGHRYFMM
ncbi:hypothetical protein SAMN05421788_1033 [Filimonas lacunae]|uniref:Tat (Twin-arginine translocation) pathway signal sequence n=1 Tax=Filimonas lacunae TaxID=477680 RepID=A0A173MJ34_9BACT|nr:hypothetical protein [Filimonas lacunae]BAV07652.1 hypothetical protein FLA_3683 [Filimonas lacunae]SIT03021.1 hypothetical protein SAMN05421788_1033 [Filimonas lacunae]